MWKRLVRRPITVSLFNGKKFIAYPDCHVSSGIVYTRIPNSRNILFLREHLSGGTLIDVEGHENSVLRGMRQFLAEKRPLVMFEYLERTNLEQTISIFAEVGYKIFELGENGPVAATSQVKPLQDLFAWPVERVSEMGFSSGTS